MVTKSKAQLEDRIIVDPKIMAGKPVIKGTRIPVELVLEWLADDLELQGLLDAYPRLTPDDVRACIAYARATMTGDVDVAEAYQVRHRRPA